MAITRLNPKYQPVGNYAAANHSHDTTTTTFIETLSSTSSINHFGYYKFGTIGGGLLTKWNAAGAEKPDDFYAVCFDFNGGADGANYGTLMVTSPRSTKIWLVGIWAHDWRYVRQI